MREIELGVGGSYGVVVEGKGVGKEILKFRYFMIA